MPDEPIPAALTADEWAKGAAERDGMMVELYAPGLDLHAVSGPDRDFAHASREMLPAVIALANAALPDGDPRKITRADVEEMQRCARLVYAALQNPHFGGMTDARSEARHAANVTARVAAKLAALLPPD